MKEISLYIHIPFCKQKCFYCDFKSYSGKEQYMKDYIDALNKEIREKCNGYIIKTIFIGGGTPSYLDEKLLEKLLNNINENVQLKYDCEFTIECNPGTLNEEKLKIMKNNNVNRLSIGLQSTYNELLKKIGRIHTYEQFKENYYMARKIGFDNINIDIMFGLPDMTVDMWENTILEIIKLKPEHISAYSLIVEEDTCFYRLYNDGKLNLPQEDDERKMYHIARDMMQESGYIQYEISNYSKKEKECRHNIVYWKDEEYIGVGVSSSSFINNKRIKNIDNINVYINNIFKNKSVYEEVYENSIEDNMEEFMFMGLRMIEGIDINTFNEKFQKNIYDVYGKEIKKHMEDELLVCTEGKLYLSPKGIELSNYVMSDFILT